MSFRIFEPGPRHPFMLLIRTARLAARFPRPPTATAAAAPELGAIAAEADAEADAEAAELVSKLA